MLETRQAFGVRPAFRESSKPTYAAACSRPESGTRHAAAHRARRPPKLGAFLRPTTRRDRRAASGPIQAAYAPAAARDRRRAWAPPVDSLRAAQARTRRRSIVRGRLRVESASPSHDLTGTPRGTVSSATWRPQAPIARGADFRPILGVCVDARIGTGGGPAVGCGPAEGSFRSSTS